MKKHGLGRDGEIKASELAGGALVVGVAAALLFIMHPDLDLVVTRHFHTGHRQFVGSYSLLFDAFRWAFNVLFFSVCATTVIGLYMTRRPSGTCLRIPHRKWLYLAACLVTGPLLIANLGFKDHWGRARPRDVVEFGGKNMFSSPLAPARQCIQNCSFVSGEASSIYIVFFAGAMVLRSKAKYLVVLGIAMGSLAGLVRIIEGAHFFSDVVFAGILMALTAAALQLLFDTQVFAQGQDQKALHDENC